MSVPRLILASTSPYRRELLARLGLPFEAISPEVDERKASAGLGPEETVLTLARAKADAVAANHPEALVIGSDQMAEIDGEALGKPGDPETAVARLMRLSGRTHRLLTAVCLCHGDTGRAETVLDVHRIVFRKLTEAAARQYVAREGALDCAGGYKVEGLGIALMRSIEGDDHTGIIGLPLTKVVELLDRFGVPVLG